MFLVYAILFVVLNGLLTAAIVRHYTRKAQPRMSLPPVFLDGMLNPRDSHYVEFYEFDMVGKKEETMIELPPVVSKSNDDMSWMQPMWKQNEFRTEPIKAEIGWSGTYDNGVLQEDDFFIPEEWR